MNANEVPYKPTPGEVIPLHGARFTSIADELLSERDARLAQSKDVLTFGVKFLDLALGGIFQNDLVLIGASSGAGKTALASSIAQMNALAGKRVHYFALEAEPMEIGRRIKFNLLAKRIYKHLSGDHDDVNYMSWYLGKIEQKCARFEAEVNQQIAERLSTLHTYYRSAEFYAEHFEQMVTSVQDSTDLIILDHLHYVDSKDPSENRGYKDIVKKIRDTALRIGKPMVVIAHLRKGERGRAQVVPELDDFHGTSDVPKIATKAVMIKRASDQISGNPAIFPTYIYPAKCRFEGSRTGFVGLCNYDIRTGWYDEGFLVGRQSFDGSKWERLDGDQVPRWAR